VGRGRCSEGGVVVEGLFGHSRRVYTSKKAEKRGKTRFLATPAP
jgi:hypothetical protein